jgi:hypothetical protein
MRRIWWAAAMTAAMMVGGQANALILNACAGGCPVQGGALFDVDYTVAADGQSYRWDLWSDAAHPDVLINLNAPNEAFDVDTISNGDGTFHTDSFLLGATFTWNEVVEPGHTTIFTRALQTDFNHCSPASSAGEVCAAQFNVWGNGSSIWVNTQDPMTVFFSQSAVPEPATWAMLLLGFFGLGAVLRRRRATPLTA